MHTTRQSGFTLVELLITLVVASVLLAVGVPSFTDAMRSSRIGSQYSQVVRSLFLARSEAVKSNDFVVVCAREAPGSTQCGDENDWRNGWIVFVDVASSPAAAAKVDAGDTIISLEPALSGDNTIGAFASLSSGADPDAVGHVRYLPRGNTDWRGGSIVICDAVRGSTGSRVVNVKLTGDIQAGRPSGTETIPRDAFNSPIDCGEGS